LTGALAAAAVDVHNFRAWKSFDEARTYDWEIAAWRWGQGALYGALAEAGIGSVI